MARLVPVFLAFFVAALATAAPTPCTVVTKAEIQEVVGKAPSDGKLNPSNNKVCHFEIGPPNGVTVSIEGVNSLNNADKVLEAFKKRKSEVQMVPSLGDRAFFVKSFGMNALSVYKGSNVVTVIVLLMSAPEAKQKAMAEKLARKALARL